MIVVPGLGQARALKRRAEQLARRVGRSSAAAIVSRLPKPKKPVRPGERLFCAQPFERFEVLGDPSKRGETYFCCENWVTRSIGNIGTSSVEEVWNGRSSREFRRSILDGTFEFCRENLCPHLQRIDGPVQRLADVTDPDLLKIIRDDLTVVPFSPKDIICCFDQSCNLSCPTCRTHIIMETEHAASIGDIQKKLEDEALEDARLLYITGSGDPFGSPYFRQWLQTMDPASMPKLEQIFLHTNGLLWTPRIWASIPEATRALIKSARMSVDAARPGTYAENRRGGDFETLLRRLAFIADLRRNGPLEYLELHMTVQLNNFEEMAEFAQLGRRFECDNVAFNQLVNWGTFSDAEYAARAVHLPEHPRHADFLAVLRSRTLQDPFVNLTNLSELAALTAAQPAMVDAAA